MRLEGESIGRPGTTGDWAGRLRQYLVPSGHEDGHDPAVVSNARITAALGLMLLVGLFIEGLTLLMGVGDNLVLHVFVGFLVLPAIVVKLGTTGWRMARYYLGDERYTRKGPPPLVLRLAGPLVALTTLGLFATGVGILVEGNGAAFHLGLLHRAAFVLWFGFMTIHVLGHLAETPRLATADFRDRGRVPGVGLRRAVLAGVVVVGLLVAGLSIAWTHSYQSGRPAKLGPIHRPR